MQSLTKSTNDNRYSAFKQFSRLLKQRNVKIANQICKIQKETETSFDHFGKSKQLQKVKFLKDLGPQQKQILPYLYLASYIGFSINQDWGTDLKMKVKDLKFIGRIDHEVIFIVWQFILSCTTESMVQSFWISNIIKPKILLSYIPKILFSQLSLLTFRDLQIDNFQFISFLNTPKLQSIALQKCRINSTKFLTKLNLPNLKSIQLTDNYIDTFPDLSRVKLNKKTQPEFWIMNYDRQINELIDISFLFKVQISQNHGQKLISLLQKIYLQVQQTLQVYEERIDVQGAQNVRNPMQIKGNFLNYYLKYMSILHNRIQGQQLKRMLNIPQNDDFQIWM